MANGRIALALDQNFPHLILDAAQLVPEVEMVPIWRIDHRLAALDDRKLVIALYQLGWRGLITNNYKMLYVPAEIAAIVKTKCVVFAVEGLGSDPLRATGAVLLDLPGAVKKIVPGKGQVFRVAPRAPQPRDPWDYFKDVATRQKVAPGSLYDEVKVSDTELADPVLTD